VPRAHAAPKGDAPKGGAAKRADNRTRRGRKKKR
jgi:hypothetical protein